MTPNDPLCQARFRRQESIRRFRRLLRVLIRLRRRALRRRRLAFAEPSVQ